jgi:hypothetical protein
MTKVALPPAVNSPNGAGLIKEQLDNFHLQMGLFFHLPDDAFFLGFRLLNSPSWNDPIGNIGGPALMLDEQDFMILNDESLISGVSCH